ncbi:unnamed protein product, partial [Oppiella nova]
MSGAHYTRILFLLSKGMTLMIDRRLTEVKSVKPCLKLLQQSIQSITAYHSEDDYGNVNPNDMFIWMPREHMCVLVYLVTVLHSMQAGYMDKAQKYTEKALMQID